MCDMTHSERESRNDGTHMREPRYVTTHSHTHSHTHSSTHSLSHHVTGNSSEGVLSVISE